MLQRCLTFLLFSNVFTIVLSKYDADVFGENAITTKSYALWRNAVVPFYVNPAHFDHEQTQDILAALALFAFRTCIKFKPVMARPDATDEVMVFINPDGMKRCHFNTRGHSVFNPHFVKLGYECLKSPQIDMMIMKALGFPFEHNRDTRDLYIEVLNENIEPGSVELFTKEDILPLELRFLPYDVNSVMHFGNREFSKNGHRTIIFKDTSVEQNRVGLTDTDIKKIEIVYGPECRARDRQEKVELCQSYPGVARKKRQSDDNGLGDREPTPESIDRKKRDVDPDKMASKSLRVNPDITPPPLNQHKDITETLKELGIDEAVEEIVEQVYKVSSLALKNARVKYCNETNNESSSGVNIAREGNDVKVRNSSDILGIIEVIADFAKGMVDHAIQNLTNFCENSEGLEVYQRYQCGISDHDPRCRGAPFKSTKSGPAAYSTQHRPILPQSTYHQGGWKAQKNYGRQGNATENSEKPATVSVRRKRDLETITIKPNDKNIETTLTDNNKTVEKAELKAIADEKEEVTKEKVTEEKNADENKEKAAKDNKEKSINEDDDIKAKFDEKVLINNKDILRKGTMPPGLDRHRYSRRSHGNDSKHPDASSKDLDKQDTKLAMKMMQKKHILQKKYRIEKRHQKIMDTDEIPIEQENLSEEKNSASEEKKNASKEKNNTSNDEITHKDLDKIPINDSEEKIHHEDSDEISMEPENISKEKEHHKNIDIDETRPNIYENTRRQHKRKHTEHIAIPVESYIKNEETEVEDKIESDAELSKEATIEKVPVKVIKVERKPVKKKIIQEDSDAEEEEMNVSENDSEERPVKYKPKKKIHLNKYDAAKRLPRTVKLSQKNKDFYGERRWPRGQLFYMIHVDTTYDLSDMRSRLKEVSDILKEKTCVKMKEITRGETNKYDDYIVIDSSPDYVTGRVGGKQKFGSIELFRGGQHRQHAAMVVMAMLGFYFEVSRHDRDKFIRVHMRHVRPDKLHHFEMIRSDATLPLPYDYASATHPAWQFWRQMGRKGISTVATYKEKDPDGSIMKSLGQNEDILSDLDIVKINSVYGVQCFKRLRASRDDVPNNASMPVLLTGTGRT